MHTSKRCTQKARSALLTGLISVAPNVTSTEAKDIALRQPPVAVMDSGKLLLLS